MGFDYEQSIWGRGEASLRPTDPTAIRLRAALRAVAKLPMGAKVLELGCGAGQFIRAIKKLRSSLQCYGSDISSTAIKRAASIGGGVEYMVSTGDVQPYGVSAFDAVLIFDVLEHVINPGAILAEVNRILKPGGLLYAFVPCENDATSLWYWLDLVGLKHNLTQRFAGHIQYFTRRDLRTLIKNAGLVIKNIRYSEHFLGQLAGVIAFNLMAKAAQNNPDEILNNEAYFSKPQNKNIKIIAPLANSLIFGESVLFSRLPSPNVHLVAVKPVPVTDRRPFTFAIAPAI